MKRKILIAVLVFCLVGAALAVLAKYENDTYITLGDIRCRRDATEIAFSVLPDAVEDFTVLEQLQTINLREAEISTGEYDRLRSVFPDVRLLWNVPFQGTSLPDDTQALKLTSLTDADLELLAYFPQLSSIDATGCRDYTMIRKLMDRYPDLDVSYTIEFGQAQYAPNATELVLTDVDIAELSGALPLLPQLQSVSLEGILPEAAPLIELTEQYPQVEFDWQVDVLGTQAHIRTTELDLSGISLTSTEELEAAVDYLPNLKTVLMLDCGLTNEQMEQLNQAHENTHFVWNIQLGQGITVRSDITVFAPVIIGMRVYDGDLTNLRYCKELEVIDLGHMPISDISFLTYLENVRFLIVADTNVSDLTPLSHLKKLQFLEIFLAPIRDYSPLLGCTALEDLNASYTYADPAPLMQMPWLKRLWLTMFHMNGEQCAALIEALPDTQVTHPTRSSTGNGWREGHLYYEMRDAMGLRYMIG